MKYNNCRETHFEYLRKLKDKVKRLSEDDSRYRYKIYVQINPDLNPSQFMNNHSKVSITDDIIRFRVGSHKLPIETGRWNRIPRELRLYPGSYVYTQGVTFMLSM